ncbi:MAG: hypothetical protein ACTHK2_02365 [Dokdonella sp.]|uniref:hypothetical protein n=1 Tax=Dokdonella sp. TaxID=2291710 RepID=UPI003F809462
MDDANAQIMLRETDWIFGSLVNISLRSEQLVPFPAVGESTGLVRVTATNHGSWDLDRVDFGACQGAVVAPFWLDGGFPGGCDDEAYGPTCFAVGPPSMQFALHNLLQANRAPAFCVRRPMRR